MHHFSTSTHNCLQTYEWLDLPDKPGDFEVLTSWKISVRSSVKLEHAMAATMPETSVNFKLLKLLNTSGYYVMIKMPELQVMQPHPHFCVCLLPVASYVHWKRATNSMIASTTVLLGLALSSKEFVVTKLQCTCTRCNIFRISAFHCAGWRPRP